MRLRVLHTYLNVFLARRAHFFVRNLFHYLRDVNHIISLGLCLALTTRRNIHCIHSCLSVFALHRGLLAERVLIVDLRLALGHAVREALVIEIIIVRIILNNDYVVFQRVSIQPPHILN